MEDWNAATTLTFALMAVASAVAFSIGVPAAAAAGLLSDCSLKSQTLDRARRALISLWLTAMLFSVIMPLILHAAGWESTAGKFGWLMKTMTGGNLIWVGWIHGVHGASLVAVATYWSTRNISPEVIRHSELDFGPVAAWFRVRLPIARASVWAALVVVWLLAATEMSVADLHSVRTVADQFYLFYSLDPEMTALVVTTWLPIFIGGVPALIWWKMRRRGWQVGGVPVHENNRSDRSTGFPETASSSGLPSMRHRFGLLTLVVVVVASLLVCQGAIAFGLVLQAGHTVEIIDGGPVASWSFTACWDAITSAPAMFAEEYAWTLQLAGLTSLAVTPLAWVLARLGRGHATLGWVIDVLVTIAFLIPGPIVALAVVRLFGSGIPGGELLATQTLVPTMLAVGVRSGVIAYLILRTAYDRVGQSVWQSSQMDYDRWTRFFRIELPMLLPAGGVALIAAAVVSSGDVPAALPVLPPGVTTVGTRLFGLLHSGSRYQEASLAFWYLTGLLALGMIAWRIIKRKMV